MKENPVLEKSFQFSIKIVDIYKKLCSESKEYVMSRQLLRCGTSIGANIHEAVHGQSEKDFLAKMYISFKETNETDYWLKLLYKTNYLSEEDHASLLKDCMELKRILSSITLTMKNKLSNS
jgi:four helix bundle protein